MRYLLYLIVILFGLQVSAQQRADTIKPVTIGTALNLGNILRHTMNPEERGMPLKEVKKHIGEDVYIVDSVSKCIIVNDSLMYWHIGNSPQGPELIIIVKGTDKQIKINRNGWAHGTIHVSGKVIIYNAKPAIVVTSVAQLGTRIMI